MGGRFKGGNFSDLRQALESRQARVVAIGEARLLIHAAFDGHVPVHDAQDMDYVDLRFEDRIYVRPASTKTR